MLLMASLRIFPTSFFGRELHKGLQWLATAPPNVPNLGIELEGSGLRPNSAQYGQLDGWFVCWGLGQCHGRHVMALCSGKSIKVVGMGNRVSCATGLVMSLCASVCHTTQCYLIFASLPNFFLLI